MFFFIVPTNGKTHVHVYYKSKHSLNNAELLSPSPGSKRNNTKLSTCLNPQVFSIAWWFITHAVTQNGVLLYVIVNLISWDMLGCEESRCFLRSPWKGICWPHLKEHLKGESLVSVWCNQSSNVSFKRMQSLYYCISIQNQLSWRATETNVGFLDGQHKKNLQSFRAVTLGSWVILHFMWIGLDSPQAVTGGQSNPGARHAPHSPVVVAVLPSLKQKKQITVRHRTLWSGKTYSSSSKSHKLF